MPTSRILFVFDDGDFKHNSRGHTTMPTATPLFNALRRQGERVCSVKEHRTSKCCSKCGKEMQQAVLHKQLPPTEDELKVRARSKQDRQIKRKAHLLVKLARKHIQPDNQQAVPLSISLRPLPITQDEADMAIKFAWNAAQAASGASAPAPMDGNGSNGRPPADQPQEAPRSGNRKLSRPPPMSVKPWCEGADLMVARNYHAKNLLMPWGLRHCGNCDTIWRCDKNACIDMHLRAMFYLRQPLKVDAQGMTLREDGPPYSRPQQQHSQRLKVSKKRFKPGKVATRKAAEAYHSSSSSSDEDERGEALSDAAVEELDDVRLSDLDEGDDGAGGEDDDEHDAGGDSRGRRSNRAGQEGEDGSADGDSNYDLGDGDNDAADDEDATAAKRGAAKLASTISKLLGKAPAMESAQPASAELAGTETRRKATTVADDSRPILSKKRHFEAAIDEAKLDAKARRILAAERKTKVDLSHVIPDHTTTDYEKKLRKIATRGVVQLFNAIRMAQKDADALQSDGVQKHTSEETHKPDLVASVSKQTFLKALKDEGPKKKSVSDSVKHAKPDKPTDASQSGTQKASRKADSQRKADDSAVSWVASDYGMKTPKHWDEEEEEIEDDF
ncbi:hypothetical protein HK105_208561 [Polyrhizophydium stewartii]|uniref:Rrp15p-domain-containing protein n=1 Tax=Polyrhizophydium stewartii TaxID=2732419 RepID=A0ABR4MXF0_9FUNG